jgi:hypothetical protein
LWEDHLLPLLTYKDAARLECACEALRGVVREHFKDVVTSSGLRAVLTTFPRTRSVELYNGYGGWRPEEEGAFLQWLREGGRGSHLATVRLGGKALDLVHTALRQGALPSLKRVEVTLDLKDEAARAYLTGGFLGAVHALDVSVDCNVHVRPQLAALGLVRELPALAELELDLQRYNCYPLQWPPFIPPSLKALRVDIDDCRAPHIGSLLCALPGMLEASGARLDRLEIKLPFDCEEIGDGFTHLAEALHLCSPTLTALELSTEGQLYFRPEALSYESKVERLRVHWADVLVGVSACRELEVLSFPNIIVETRFPPGTVFGRLTQLKIYDCQREHPPDAGGMGLWKLMASGGLPVLAKLTASLPEGEGGGVELARACVAPALEAVAGTLTHLYLNQSSLSPRLSEEVDVGHELGVALNKLRRLKDLILGLSEDGRVYHALVQGLAASVCGGGSSPATAGRAAWRNQGQCLPAGEPVATECAGLRLGLRLRGR